MPNDPDKQPVDTQTTVTWDSTAWLSAGQYLDAFHGHLYFAPPPIPIGSPPPWPTPFTLYSIRTDPGGHRFYLSDPSESAPLQIQLGWGYNASDANAWWVTLLLDHIATTGEQWISWYKGPSTDSPTGPYYAADTIGTPDPALDPPTGTITA